MRARPVWLIAVAAVAATAGVTGAVLLDSAAASAVLLVATVAVIGGCAVILRRRDDGVALGMLVAVPVMTLSVGVPTVAVLSTGSPASSRSVTGGRSIADRLAADYSSLLSAALRRADELVPGGSNSVLKIDIDGGGGLEVAVFDRRTGHELYSARSGETSGWRDSDRGRAGKRTVFTRAQLAGLDLTAVAPTVAAAAPPLIGERPAGSSGQVVVERRNDDDLLVAAFTVAGERVEVNADGTIADTIGAATLDGMLAVARAAMTGAGVDPETAELYELQYRAVDDDSDSISATVVQNSGGIDMRFAAGQPVQSITVVPGQFPVVERRPATGWEGFPFRKIRQPVLLAVRQDIMRRAGSPAYDAGLIGLAVGEAPFDPEYGTVIRMKVGPTASTAAGMYTLDGRWLADRSY